MECLSVGLLETRPGWWFSRRPLLAEDKPEIGDFNDPGLMDFHHFRLHNTVYIAIMSLGRLVPVALAVGFGVLNGEIS